MKKKGGGSPAHAGWMRRLLFFHKSEPIVFFAGTYLDDISLCIAITLLGGSQTTPSRWKVAKQLQRTPKECPSCSIAKHLALRRGKSRWQARHKAATTEAVPHKMQELQPLHVLFHRFLLADVCFLQSSLILRHTKMWSMLRERQKQTRGGEGQGGRRRQRREGEGGGDCAGASCHTRATSAFKSGERERRKEGGTAAYPRPHTSHHNAALPPPTSADSRNGGRPIPSALVGNA